MVEVTLVQGGEESLTDPALDDVVCHRVSLTTTTFLIRQNMRGYLLPTR